MLDRKVRLRFF